MTQPRADDDAVAHVTMWRKSQGRSPALAGAKTCVNLVECDTSVTIFDTVVTVR